MSADAPAGDVQGDVTPPVDVPADAPSADAVVPEAGADAPSVDVPMDSGADVPAVDAIADVPITDLGTDARTMDAAEIFGDLPAADIVPTDLGIDVRMDASDVSGGFDASDGAGCVPRMPPTATMQVNQGGYGPVLALDPLGFAVLTSRNRTTDPGILYFGRYGIDGAPRDSIVASPVADMGRLGGVVWDGARYQLTYYRSSDRAILLAGMSSMGSLESSPIVINPGTPADTERAPMSVNTVTGERCVMWRQRGIGTAPPVLHATLVGADDIPTDIALDSSPSDGFEVLGISHPMHRCLYVWSAGGAIRAIGLPGGAATTIVPAGAATRSMVTVAAVATADRYVVAWNQASGDAPGLYTLPIDGLLRTLGEARRVETLAAGVSVRRLAVLSASSGYELVTERTDIDTFVQRVPYGDDGSVTGPAVRVVNVCALADAVSERLPVATRGTRRYGAFMDLRVSSSVIATF